MPSLLGTAGRDINRSSPDTAKYTCNKAETTINKTKKTRKHGSSRDERTSAAGLFKQVHAGAAIERLYQRHSGCIR